MSFLRYYSCNGSNKLFIILDYITLIVYYMGFSFSAFIAELFKISCFPLQPLPTTPSPTSIPSSIKIVFNSAAAAVGQLGDVGIRPYNKGSNGGLKDPTDRAV